MQRRAAEESLTDHGKDNSNGRAHVGDAIRHKPGILGFLRQIGFMGAIHSFDELIVAILISGADYKTIPRQMWSGAREELSPVITAAATISDRVFGSHRQKCCAAVPSAYEVPGLPEHDSEIATFRKCWKP